MPHNAHIKQLLEELYQIEPGLREKEEDITKIITQMIALKPTVQTPENFKKILKNRLLSEIVQAKTGQVHTKNRYFRFFWYFLGVGALASFAVSF